MEDGRVGAEQLLHCADHNGAAREQKIAGGSDPEVAGRSDILFEGDRAGRGVGRHLNRRRADQGSQDIAFKDNVAGAGDVDRASRDIARGIPDHERNADVHQACGLHDLEPATDVDAAVDGHASGRHDGQILQRFRPADVALDHDVAGAGDDRQALRCPGGAAHAVSHAVETARNCDIAAQRPRADRDVLAGTNNDTVVNQLIVPVRVDIVVEDRRMGRSQEVDGGIPNSAQEAHNMDASRHLRGANRHGIAEGIGAHLDLMAAIRTTDGDAIEPVQRRAAKAIDDPVELVVFQPEAAVGPRPDADGLVGAQRLQHQRAARGIAATSLAEIPAPEIGVDLDQVGGQHQVAAARVNPRQAGIGTGDDHFAREVQEHHVATERVNAALGVGVTRHTHVADGQAVQFHQIHPSRIAARAGGGHLEKGHLDINRLRLEPDAGGIQDAEVSGLDQDRRTQAIRARGGLRDQQRVGDVEEDRIRLHAGLQLQRARADDEVFADVNGTRHLHHPAEGDELQLVESRVGDRRVRAAGQLRARDRELVARQIDVECADRIAAGGGEEGLDAVARVRDDVRAGNRIDGEVHRYGSVAKRGEVERVAAFVREFNDRVVAVTGRKDVAVVPGAARECISRRSADERIVAGTAEESVTRHATAQPVVAIAAVGDHRHVHASINLQPVVTRAAIEVDAGDAGEVYRGAGDTIHPPGYLVVAPNLLDFEVLGHVGGAAGIQAVRGIVARAQNQRAGREDVHRAIRRGHGRWGCDLFTEHAGDSRCGVVQAQEHEPVHRLNHSEISRGREAVPVEGHAQEQAADLLVRQRTDVRGAGVGVHREVTELGQSDGHAGPRVRAGNEFTEAIQRADRVATEVQRFQIRQETQPAQVRHAQPRRVELRDAEEFAGEECAMREQRPIVAQGHGQAERPANCRAQGRIVDENLGIGQARHDHRELRLPRQGAALAGNGIPDFKQFRDEEVHAAVPKQGIGATVADQDVLALPTMEDVAV